MATSATAQLDRERIRSLTERERAELDGRTQNSLAMYRRARESLSGGVASSYQARDPWPIYLATGAGPLIHDVDGNRMWDFHSGFGSMVQGHANPAIVAAIRRRAGLGTHFAATTEEGVAVAEELRRRFAMDRWRFLNSGSEATMDAIRIARGYTGRDEVVKIFGSYHGHHDAVMVSIGVEYDRIGDRENYESLPYGAGIPDAVSQLTVAVPFNDAGAMERRIERLEREDRKPACVIMEAAMMNLGVEYDRIGDRENYESLPYGAGIPDAVSQLTVAVPFNDAPAMERRIERLEREDRKPACVIMEAAMMNLGVVLPRPGYLEEVRELTRRHGVVLIFDEVKTGLAIAAGGACERFGVQPDMVTLAKTLGGGLPAAAVGGSEEVMRVVEDGTVYQVGTYNGNPLAMAAAHASLTDVLTPAAYEHLDHLNERIVSGCQAVIDRHGLPGYAIGVGAKGCVTFSPTTIVDYETFKANQDVELTELAWLYSMNRGIFMTPGREEEWTLSVMHTNDAVDAYVQVFDSLARELTV